MTILSVNTSAKVCSVAIHQEGILLASTNIFSERVASSQLTPIIDKLLAACGLAYKQLNAVAVAKGPGSYTGLRIGVSTAKGLCFALDIPLIGINTLEAMAYVAQSQLPGYYYVPMLDARRMEVFTAVYDPNLALIKETHAEVLTEESYSELLATNKLLFFGDGSLKSKEIFAPNPNIVYSTTSIEATAEGVGYLASKRYAEGKFENLVTFEPYYLKEFIGVQAQK
jgi:tRNA threonylcarbamoyladenosine biosynthesis protein TsaB